MANLRPRIRIRQPKSVAANKSNSACLSPDMHYPHVFATDIDPLTL